MDDHRLLARRAKASSSVELFEALIPPLGNGPRTRVRFSNLNGARDPWRHSQGALLLKWGPPSSRPSVHTRFDRCVRRPPAPANTSCQRALPPVMAGPRSGVPFLCGGRPVGLRARLVRGCRGKKEENWLQTVLPRSCRRCEPSVGVCDVSTLGKIDIQRCGCRYISRSHLYQHVSRHWASVGCATD